MKALGKHARFLSGGRKIQNEILKNGGNCLHNRSNRRNHSASTGLHADVCVFSLIATAGSAQTAAVGSGPYPAIIEGDPGVPDHTIYRPENLSAFSQRNSLPVVAWGNGACANSSRFYAPS
jgi:hypothetical protein